MWLDQNIKTLCTLLMLIPQNMCKAWHIIGFIVQSPSAPVHLLEAANAFQPPPRLEWPTRVAVWKNLSNTQQAIFKRLCLSIDAVASYEHGVTG